MFLYIAIIQILLKHVNNNCEHILNDPEKNTLPVI